MPTILEYRRLRAPKEHGQTLQDPTLGASDQVMQSNLRIDRSQVSIGDQPLVELAELGRQEIFDLAREHTSQYFNVADFLDSRDWSQVVMSGHQPTLFHPGVWFKNFALSSIGKELRCGAINLVVDNDICGVASIKIPNWDGEKARFDLLPIDGAGDNVPFEERTIVAPDFFDSFANRASNAVSQFIHDPIANSIWKSAKELRQSNNNLGNVLAAVRHQFELEHGLETLEVPLSQVSGTTAFAKFTQHLLERSDEFQSVYNDTLLEYRRVHKIRSRSHPVPPLGTQGEWFEAPLWIWNRKNQLRGRLFTKTSSEHIQLTNRADINLKLERKHFVEQFIGLGLKGVAIRPRALMTTMFSRTVLSDLFLHGIGGAKYDQLTDQIIQSFFGLEPLQFMTLTATMKLPFDYQHVDRNDLMQIKNQLRDLKYHGETKLASDEAEVRETVEQKRIWINKQLPKGQRLDRHRKITTFNDKLQPYLAAQRKTLEEKLVETASKIEIGKVLGSREFSFCLFPHQLVSELKSLANHP